MDKQEMYNTMSIYKQKLIEIEDKIVIYDNELGKKQKDIEKVFKESIENRKPKYFIYLLITLGLFAVAFISLPVLIFSLIAMITNAVFYMVNLKNYNKKNNKINTKLHKLGKECIFLKLQKSVLQNEKNFILENIKLFQDFVYSKKIPTKQQEEEMQVSKSIAKTLIRGDNDEILERYY